MDESLKIFLSSLAPFNEEELLEAGQYFQPACIAKDNYFLKAGHYSNQIAFVKSGLLRSYFVQNNKETTTFFVQPGSIAVDLHSFLQQIPSNESYHALEDTEILSINRKSLYFLYQEDWKWQQVGRVLMETYFVAAEERNLRLQSLSAQQLYENFVKQHPEVLRSAPLSYIASYLGMTRETLSRIRRFKNDKQY